MSGKKKEESARNNPALKKEKTAVFFEYELIAEMITIIKKNKNRKLCNGFIYLIIIPEKSNKSKPCIF